MKVNNVVKDRTTSMLAVSLSWGTLCTVTVGTTVFVRSDNRHNGWSDNRHFIRSNSRKALKVIQ